MPIAGRQFPGLAAIVHCLVLVGACRAEQTHDLQAYDPCVVMHACVHMLSLMAAYIQVPVFTNGDLQVPIFTRPEQGSGTILHCLVKVGPCLTEQTHHVQETDIGRSDQGRGAILHRLVLVIHYMISTSISYNSMS